MEAIKILPSDGLILDVRTDMECAEKRLCRAHVHVPLDQLDAREFAARHNLNPESGLYILCRSGQRAARAAEKFTAIGFGNVHVIPGGIQACEECGEKLEGHQTGTRPQHKARLSLERQVRIAAGSFVLLGSALGFFIDSAFIALPAVVGAGLIFAGVTDRCGLMLILTRMPWNKI
jgi:rhodanese-related sulfurtransferase